MASQTSLKIMMQFTPDNINIESQTKNLTEIKGIKNIHHIHIWQINEHDIMFEAHIDLENDVKISEFEEILEKVKEHLHSEYDIHHVTLQPEFAVNDNKRLIMN